MYGLLIHSLRLLKMFHDIGIYEKAAGDIKEIAEDDYYELIALGLELVAPVYEAEELGEDHCCGGHVVHRFSDPAVPEYYRLCRLYEHQRGIALAENPYVKKADDYYIRCCHNTNGEFATNFDDEAHPRGIWVEICPERHVCEAELIELVYDMLEFFRSEVETLRAELLKGPVVWLPALPAPRKQIDLTKKPRHAGSNPLEKAS